MKHLERIRGLVYEGRHQEALRLTRDALGLSYVIAHVPNTYQSEGNASSSSFYGDSYYIVNSDTGPGYEGIVPLSGHGGGHGNGLFSYPLPPEPWVDWEE